MRYWAAMALGAMGKSSEPTVQSALVAALDDSHPAVRIEAANALARTGDVDQALPVLVRELESDSDDVVLHAARAIELQGKAAAGAAGAMKAARERADHGGTIEMFIQFSVDAFLSQLEQ